MHNPWAIVKQYWLGAPACLRLPAPRPEPNEQIAGILRELLDNSLFEIKDRIASLERHNSEIDAHTIKIVSRALKDHFDRELASINNRLNLHIDRFNAEQESFQNWRALHENDLDQRQEEYATSIDAKISLQIVELMRLHTKIFDVIQEIDRTNARITSIISGLHNIAKDHHQ